MIKLFILIYSLYSFHFNASHWAHEKAELPEHPDYRYERLDNGFSYAWHKVTGKDGSSCQIRLHVDVGSLQEEKNEQGMAHFLEHMAFKGNKHISADLIKAMQSLGLTFGAHSNAHTTYSETVYKFDLVGKCNKERLEKILNAVGGIADGLLLNEEEIQIEKGVIDAEEKVRLQQAVIVNPTAVYEKAVPELKQMNSIGEKRVRDQFNSAMVRKFYEKWYVPQAMKLIVVSDIDELDDFMTSLVPAIFRTMKRGEYQPRTILKASVVNAVHLAQQNKASPFSVAMSGRWQKTTIGSRNLLSVVEHEKQRIVIELLRARLEHQFGDEFKGKDILLFDQDLSTANSPQAHMQETRIPLLGVIFSVFTTSGNIIAEAAACEHLVDNAVAHGFFEQEIKEALEKHVKTLTNQDKEHQNAAIIEELLNDARGFLAPLNSAQIDRLIVPELKKITTDEAQVILKQLWGGTSGTFVFGNIPDFSDEQMLAALKNAKTEVILRPLTQNEAVKSSYAHKATSIGGKVILQESTGPKSTKVVFENNLLLRIFARDEKKIGEFQITIKTPGSTTGPKMRKQHVVANGFLRSFKNIVGMKDHVSSELKQMFSKEYQDFDISWNDDGLRLMSYSPEPGGGRNLLTQLELLLGYFARPQLNQKEFGRLKANKLSEIAQMRETLFREFQEKVFGENASCYHVVVSAKDIDDLTEDDFMVSLDPLLFNGSLEIDFFGVEPLDEVIDAVGRTFGTLMARKSAAQDSTIINQPERPFMLSQVTMKVNAPQLVQAYAMMYYPFSAVTVLQDHSKTRQALELLKTIVLERVFEISRNKYGTSYTLGADIRINKDDIKTGTLQIQLDLEPKQVKTIIDQIIGVIDALAKQGPSEDEFERAKVQNSGTDFISALTSDQIKTLAHEVLGSDLVSYAVATPLD